MIANDTYVEQLHPPGSHCKAKGSCLSVGFLPYNRFPRTGEWHGQHDHNTAAHIYHLTYGCMQEKAPCTVSGKRPVGGHRQLKPQAQPRAQPRPES